MATDIERLVVQMSADFRAYSNEMRKLQGDTNKRMRAVENRNEQAVGHIRAMWAGAGEGIRAALAGVTVGALLVGLRTAANDIAEIGAEAKRAGVGAEAFQELGFAAKQSRVGIDALTDGLKEMQLRADEFITTGTGGGAEAFQRLGLGADELKRRLQDPAALFQEIIDRLGQLDTASQIRIADEIFGGTGGEQFVRFLQQGAGYIARTRQEARDLGIVLDAELIKKAEKIAQQFDVIALVIGTNVKKALVSVVATLGEFVDMLSKAENQQVSTLQARIDALRAAADNMEKSTLAFYAGGGDQGLARRRAEIAMLEKEIELRKTVDAATVPVTNWKTPTSAGDLSQVGAAQEMRKAYEQLLDMGRQRISALETETATVGMATQQAETYRLQQELLSAAQSQNIQLTDAQRAAIAAVAQEYGVAAAAAEAAATSHAAAIERLDTIRSTIGDVVGSFTDDLRDGVDLADALTDALGRVLDRISDIALEAALSGLFGTPGTSGGGALGKLLGFSSGGYTGGGNPRAAAGVVHKGEYVFSKPAVDRLGLGNLDALHRRGDLPGFAAGGAVAVPTPSLPAAQNGGLTVTYAPQYSIAAGASVEAVAELRRIQDDDRRQFAARTIRTLQDARRRNANI